MGIGAFLKRVAINQPSGESSQVVTDSGAHQWRAILTNPWACVGYVAVAKIVIHILSNRQYGFHRDEFYYLIGGQRLEWGYVDHPPFTPLMARAATEIFGPTSLGGLRLVPAVAGGGMVLLTAFITQQLGGRPRTQILSAMALVATPIFMATNGMFQTVTFDQLWWLVGTAFLVLLLKTGDLRYWIAIGVTAGLGLQTKYTIVLWGIGMVIGILFTQHRAMLKTPYPYLGGLIALAIFSPNLLWQIQNDFPSLEFTENNNINWREEASSGNFLISQVLFLGPVLLPLALFGLYHLFSEQNKTYRPLGWLALSVLAVSLLTQAKPYYVGPLYPLLLAAGVVGIERWMQNRSNLESAKWIQYGLFGAVVLNGLIPAPLVMPVLPLQSYVNAGLIEVNDEFGEMVGWPELIEQIKKVYDSLPADEQAKAIILTGSYGEASAINILGDELPEAYSGHNSYYLWGIGEHDGGVVIAVRMSEAFLRQHFDDVRLAATIQMPYDIENEIYGQPIYVCRAPKQPLYRVWQAFKHYE